MPSIKTITPLIGGSYYHIFNRGINRQLLFFQDRNYHHFLHLLKKHLTEHASILAYSLLPNHFHLVIKVKDVIFLKDDIPGTVNGESEVGAFVSNQFRKMFVAYSMAVNKQEGRTGILFDRTFKRLEINNHDYLEYAIFYTHYNPEKHGLTNNFKSYRYSSFKAITGTSQTSIDRNLVAEIYGNMESFLDYHNGWHEENSNIILE